MVQYFHPNDETKVTKTICGVRKALRERKKNPVLCTEGVNAKSSTLEQYAEIFHIFRKKKKHNFQCKLACESSFVCVRVWHMPLHFHSFTLTVCHISIVLLHLSLSLSSIRLPPSSISFSTVLRMQTNSVSFVRVFFRISPLHSSMLIKTMYTTRLPPSIYALRWNFFV